MGQLTTEQLYMEPVLFACLSWLNSLLISRLALVSQRHRWPHQHRFAMRRAIPLASSCRKAGGVFGSLPTAVFSAAAPAKAVDWRTSGKVTPVGNQGGW